MRTATTRSATTRSLATGLLAVVLVGAGSGAARAQGGDDHERRVIGSCSAATDWKLKVKQDDGRLEVELEIDANRVGQRWGVTMSDGQHRFFAGSRVTQGRSGSFEVERLVTNRGGADHIRAVAHNDRTGERCSAALTYAG
jgi:hypothetical protein